MNWHPIINGLLVLGSLLATACRDDQHSSPVEAEQVPDAVHSLDFDSLDTALETDAYADIDALLVLKDGGLVYERYFNGYDADKVHDFASVTKSITSLLVGIATDIGHIESIDEPIHRYYESTVHSEAFKEGKERLTLRHLLTMQHGLDCDDYGHLGMWRFRLWLKANDPVQAVLLFPMNKQPGSVTAYCTASTELLRIPLESSTGLPVETFANEVLFHPLGINEVEWEINGDGSVALGHGINMRPRDVATIGLMIENGGVWDGKRVVSAAWLADSFARHGTLLGIDYGYLWYAEEYNIGGETVKSYLAMGHGGQFLILFPELNAIIVIAASDYEMKLDFYQLIAEKILPSLLE
ncbi:MAG: serine hydrolase [Verrucomicrobiota bacterium]